MNFLKWRSIINSGCKKGSISKLIVVLAVIICIIFVVILVLRVITKDDKDGNKKVIKQQEIEEIEDNEGSFYNLDLDIPVSFMEMSLTNYDTILKKNYVYNHDGGYCDLNLSLVKDSYDSSKKYLEENVYYSDVDVVSSIEGKIINGVGWDYFSKVNNNVTSYYYAVVRNDKVYEVNFNIYAGNQYCNDSYEEIINSLMFIGR